MPATPDRISVTPDQTPSDAFLHLADKLTEAADLNLMALHDSDEAEPVHKARVALRRFRAMLDAFAPILDEDLTEALQDRSRTLFRILGNIRDSDVMAARFADTDRAEKTAKEAAQQRQKGRKALRKKNAAGFRARVMKRLSGKGWRQSGKKAKALRDGPLTDLAARALTRAWTAALSNGHNLPAMSHRAQHELRKDLKMLRYLSEFFADLWPGDATNGFLATLRALQDDLGEVSDTATAKALGHDDDTDTTDPQTRAATAWQSLVSAGPWWG